METYYRLTLTAEQALNLNNMDFKRMASNLNREEIEQADGVDILVTPKGMLERDFALKVPVTE